MARARSESSAVEPAPPSSKNGVPEPVAAFSVKEAPTLPSAPSPLVAARRRSRDDALLDWLDEPESPLGDDWAIVEDNRPLLAWLDEPEIRPAQCSEEPTSVDALEVTDIAGRARADGRPETGGKGEHAGDSWPSAPVEVLEAPLVGVTGGALRASELRTAFLKSKNENTRRAYEDDFRRVAVWFDRDGDELFDDLLSRTGEETSEAVRDCIERMEVDGLLSPATCRRTLTALRGFFNFAQAQGVINWRLTTSAPYGAFGETLHERVIRDQVEEYLEKETDAGRALVDTLKKVRRNEIPRWFVDFVVQRYRGELDIYDAFALLELHSRWLARCLGFAHIEVGKRPASNREQELNTRRLKMLPFPFEGSVSGSLHDDYDGSIRWSEPIIFSFFCDENCAGCERCRISVQPDSAILEVGTTASSRTLVHFVERVFLARWPYNHETVYVAYRRRPKIDYEKD